MEEFNVYDLYLNQVKEDDIYNSKEYKFLKDNNIDTAEIEGIDPDPDAGEIKFDKNQKISDEENKILLKDVTDFILDIPRDTFISALRGGTNGMQFVNNFAGAIGLTEDSTVDEFNEKFNRIKSDLDNAQADSPLVTKMIGMAGQDAMYVYPIYKKLEKAGLPKTWRLPISFALGGALAFDKTESFFVDSNSMRNLKEYIGIAPDTPIEEMYDKTVQAIEFGAFGKIFDDVLGLAKNYKKMDKDRVKQADIAVGGSAGSAAVVEQFTDDPNQATNEMTPNLNPSEEKKNPNFNDDQSSIPGTVNEYGFEKTASLAPVFRSVLKETAKNLPNKGSGQQIFNTLKNTPGLKQQELKWSGLDEFLQNKKSVTKEEVKEYLENNSLDVAEIQRPRRNTPAEDEQELLLESKLGDLDMNIAEFKRKNPDALVSNELDNYNFKVRAVGTDFNEETSKNTSGLLRNLFDANNLTEDQLLSKFLYKDKVVIHYLRDAENDPRNLVGTKPYPVEEADRLISQEGFERSSRYEFEPLEVRKYFVNKELKQFDERLINSGTKFGTSEYTEPGGTDYKEIIFKLKGDGSYPIEKQLENSISSGTEPLKSFKRKSSFPYRSPSVHFGTKNEFAHVRFKTRDLKGQKVLTVEEMQSDIVQDMSKNFGERVTDFPFKNSWYELVTKRLIRYAADNDFDAVAIPKGETIADRYKQSTAKAIRVNVKPKLTEAGTDPSFEVTYFGGGNRELKRKTFYAEELNQFEKEIGSKNYSQLKGNIDNFVKNRPEDELFNTNYFAEFDEPLIVGSGKGKVDLYDKAIPSFIKKYGKKWNAKVYDDVWDGSVEATTKRPGQPDLISPGSDRKLDYTIIQLTPEMKQSVQQDGQALFNIFGIGSAAAIGSDAVLQNDRNNTISNLTEN